MNVATTLTKAADWLEEHDWCTEEYYSGVNYNYPESCCTLGAINFVCTGDPEEGNNAANIAEKALGYFTGTWNIPYWNDKTDNSKENVIETLRDCAKTL